MKIDAPLSGLPLVEVRQRAAELEQLSFDGVWGDECQHDPFLPMLEMALGTEKLHFWNQHRDCVCTRHSRWR